MKQMNIEPYAVAVGVAVAGAALAVAVASFRRSVDRTGTTMSDVVDPPVKGSLGDEAAVLEMMPVDEALDALQTSDTSNDETFKALATHEPPMKRRTRKPS